MAATQKETYLRLLGYVLPYRRTFGFAILAMIILAATEPAVPALMKPLLDGSFVDRDMDTVETVAILLVGVFAVRGLTGFLSAVCLAWVAGKLVMDLRTAMFDRLLSVPARFNDGNPSPKLISKVTYDANQVMEAGTFVVTVLIKDSLAIIGLLAWMAWIDWQLTLIAVVTAPFVATVVRYFSRRLRHTSTGLQDSMGDITHVLDEALEGRRVVRVFGGQDYERSRFRKAANRSRLFHLKFTSAGNATAPISQLIVSIALAAVILLAAKNAASGELTVGGFASFFGAMALIFSPLRRLTNVNTRLQKGLAAAHSVFALIDEPAEKDDGTRVIGRTEGAIHFRGVSFIYPEAAEPALKHIDLSIKPGETVALVGASGSGKTTLTHLLPRFYDVNEGAVLLDGVDIRDMTLGSLRSQIALVSQDVVLFNDTVAANIAYGPMSDVPREEIERAATEAHAMDFIRNLPQGLDTDIGENGILLSGGQRQRLAIARAFLKRAPVLVLDEATSALDSVSEQHVQAALEELRKGRTTLIVAHRLSTVEKADRIIVLSNGAIAEMGTHAELLARNTLYAGLYRFQFNRSANG